MQCSGKWLAALDVSLEDRAEATVDYFDHQQTEGHHPQIRVEILIRHLIMTFEDFNNSLTASQPPVELTPALAGLWWDAKGDWKRAHERAQEDEGSDASWVHAYLHRKEGDQQNAAYWYRRARKPVCRESFEAEWRRIVSGLVD